MRPITVKRRRAERWEWVLAGTLHRGDGPSVEWDDGSKEWHNHGKLHRLDGPAIDYVISGESIFKSWWIDVIQYNCIEWMLKVHELEHK